MRMPEGKTQLLWRIVTKQQARPQQPEEVYAKLADSVFGQDASERLAAMPGWPSADKDRLIQKYVDMEVDPRYLTQFERGRAVGSEFILEFKKKHREEPDRLTYEHLLADRICEPSRNIVLVGPTGSGKSYRLLYIFHKYISNLPHCRERGLECKCDLRCRTRIRADVDMLHCKTASEFYDKVYLCVISDLDHLLGRLGPRYVQDRYNEFIRELFAEGQVLPSFLPTLWADGLSFENVRDGAIPSLEDVRLSCLEQGHQREVLQLVLRFCGWLRNRMCAGNPSCLYVEFDNVDASSLEVQDALVSILEDTRPLDDALLVCACRSETLSRWRARRQVLDVVFHAGPSAYSVIMHYLDAFVQQYVGLADTDQRIAALQSALHNMSPREFLDNLVAVRTELAGIYLRVLLERLFGQQIRAGLLFASSIVEVAAALTKTALARLLTEQSVYALERKLYRPFGMNSLVPRVVNVFGLSPEREHRLLGLRILEVLASKGPYALHVKDVCNHLRPLADSSDVVTCLNNIIECELALSETKEHARLGTDEKSMQVRLRLTDTGSGLLGACYSYNYVSTQMYYTICDEQTYRYPTYSAEESAGDPSLETVFSTLRVFLRETADMEKDDIVRAVKYAEAHAEQDDLLDEQGNLLLQLRMPVFYENMAVTAARIAMATGTMTALVSALNFNDEYTAWRHDIRVLRGVVLPAAGEEYSITLDRLIAMSEELAETRDGRQDSREGYQGR